MFFLRKAILVTLESENLYYDLLSVANVVKMHVSQNLVAIGDKQQCVKLNIYI